MSTGYDTNNVTITAVIPAYNSGEHIGRAIESVLKQSYHPDEIIVVDNNSTDNTAEVIKGFGEKVRYLFEGKKGASAARNTGIKAAKSEWIAFLDADDEWLENKLEIQHRLLQKNPQLAWATGNYIDCLCEENKTAPAYTSRMCRKITRQKEYIADYLSALASSFLGCTDTKIIKKKALLETGLFDEELPMANDIDMWLKIAYKYPAIGFSPEPLAIYHLSTPASIVKTYRNDFSTADFVLRHCDLALQNNRLEQFRPVAEKLLRRHFRSMLFADGAKQVRAMAVRCKHLLPHWYRIYIRMLTASPALTSTVLHLLSAINRKLKIRKKITRKPPRPQR
jgi:glycosyltransferase involved in cell wall biosynthesis